MTQNVSYSPSYNHGGNMIDTLILIILSCTFSLSFAADYMKPTLNNDQTSLAEEGPARAGKIASTFEDYLDGDELLGGKFTTWVEFATDYVFRGESETNDGKIPSLKGAITWVHPDGLLAGYYAANNLFPGGNSAGNNSDVNALSSPFIGYSKSRLFGSGLNYYGVIHQYIYSGSSKNNYSEMFNYVDHQFGNMNLKFEYSATLSDWFGVKGLHSHNIAFHTSYLLPHKLNLSGTIGDQMFVNNGPSLDANGNGKEELDWMHWNVGISRKMFGYTFDLRYHDTNIKEGKHDIFGFDFNHQIVKQRYVFSVSKSF